MAPDVELVRETKPRGFNTTRWSLIIQSAGLKPEEAKARTALAELCHIYWRPVFTFISRRGHMPEDAQDLTQEFFAYILQTNWLRLADPNRGRFRSFLVSSLENFLHDAADKKEARKRGGRAQFVSWDEWKAEAPSELTISAHALETLSPDRLFDVRWAATVVEQALLRLGEICEQRGRLRLFDALSSYITAERDGISYTKIGASLGLEASAVKKQLHNLRLRFRSLLREEVARTVPNEADVDDEIRHLCAALASSAN